MRDRLTDQWQVVVDEFKEIVWKRLIELEERVKELENALRNKKQ